jgi:aminopeptidase-like protein
MSLNREEELAKLEHYFDRLWPICRSLTGDGVRESLAILSEEMDLETSAIKSGEQVFDWTVPKEWRIRDAYIVCPDGRRIAQFKENNLHVLNYSTPVDETVSLEELKAHLYSLPSMPQAVPYVTSYYKEKWGFCMSYEELESLEEGDYRVFIDSELFDGELNYAEAVLEGESGKEILFSTYICHPSMANNELSGPLATLLLYRRLKAIKNRKYTYRFLFAPETIGVIAYLAREGQGLKANLEAGYVLTCCGDRGIPTYKRSKREAHLVDEMAIHTLKHLSDDFNTIPFSVGGSDERQYCSPGFNLPVGSLMRTPYQQFKEYHTSLDNKDFISFEHLLETVDYYTNIAKGFELNDCYFNAVQHCEPQLGKRGLYPDSVTTEDPRTETHRLLHFLSFSDGETPLLKIAELRNDHILDYEGIVKRCKNAGLV